MEKFQVVKARIGALSLDYYQNMTTLRITTAGVDIEMNVNNVLATVIKDVREVRYDVSYAANDGEDGYCYMRLGGVLRAGNEFIEADIEEYTLKSMGYEDMHVEDQPIIPIALIVGTIKKSGLEEILANLAELAYPPLVDKSRGDKDARILNYQKG